MPNIPPDIEAAEVAGRIPPGISLEYLAQSRDQPAKIAILFVGTLTFVIVVARCCARLFLVKKFGLDDALAVFTIFLYITIIALCMVLIDLGSGRHIEYIQYVLPLPQVNETEVLDFVMHVLYTTALFVCRLSGLAFYQRLASHHHTISLAIKVSAGFLLVAYLAQFFLLLFHCVPVTGLWPYAWQLEINDFTCITWGEVYSVNSGLSLTCDLMMLIIPSMLIYMLQVSTKRKFQLSLILFPGVLVLVISSVRVYLVAIGQWAADGSWAYDPMLAIETSEIGGTLIALSIPALKPLFGSWFSHIKAYSSTRTGRSRKSNRPQQRDYVHNSDHSVKLSTLGHNRNQDIGFDSYQVNIAAGRKPVVSTQTSSVKETLRNDGSSEDLLISGNVVAKEGRLGVRNGIHLREEVSVSSARTSDFHERP